MNRRGACALLLGGLLGGVVPVLAAVDTQIDVSRSGELYVVDAVMVVPFSPREAWDVLTDFDAMASFVPNLEVSRVTSRSGDRLQVEQRGVARWGPLSQTFYDSPRDRVAADRRGPLEVDRRLAATGEFGDALFRGGRRYRNPSSRRIFGRHVDAAISGAAVPAV